MRTPSLRLAVHFAMALTPVVLHAQAASEITRQRQEIIDGIRTARPESVASRRWVCLCGRAPAYVRDARQGGFNFTPDAADNCIAALTRKAKDRALLEPYKKLASDLQGNSETYDRLPKAIGAAVLAGQDTVSIGNGKGVKIDSALAFDAGFTVAYLSAAQKKEGVDPQKLKAFAESCLDQSKDAGTCFSVGYALGSQAVNAQ